MEEHKCPYCGLVMLNLEYFLALYDYKCPKCGMFNLSQFNLVKGDENG